MTDRDLGQEILDGIREIKRFKKGEIKLKTPTLSDPSPPKATRGLISKARKARPEHTR